MRILCGILLLSPARQDLFTKEYSVPVNFFRKELSHMKAYERLLSYVKIFTPSNEESSTSPSSQCQFDLAHVLVDELKGLGLSDISLDEHC